LHSLAELEIGRKSPEVPAGRRHTPRTKKLGFVIGLSEMGLSRKPGRDRDRKQV
jgi:hypothetical protein